MHQQQKILGNKELIENLKGKKIVTCNGSFDVFHYGHLYFLQQAKKQGDVLVVLLNSDASIKKYKSEDRPINNQDDRAKVLAALECVDYVTIFDDEDPRRLLDQIKPNVHVNGEEYGEDCIEAETIKKNGGKLHLVKRIPGLSTTSLIEKIKKTY